MLPLVFFFTALFSIQGDSRVIMSLTKFVMQPTLHLHLLCGFVEKYTGDSTRNNEPDQILDATNITFPIESDLVELVTMNRR
jgi:hypothetical protein